MHRLAKFEIGRRFEQPFRRLLARLLFGAVCAELMIILRSVLSMWAPTSGPFALVYPTVLLATLYGRWQAGLVAYFLSFLWAWYFILPEAGSFHFTVETDPSRTAINALVALLVLLFAEVFRRAVEKAIGERDSEIERRILLMQELEHRTKNNFALAASLLELQKRRSGNPEVEAALDQAISRIHSFSLAYADLAQAQGEGTEVEMKPYLEAVVRHVARAGLHEGVRVHTELSSCTLKREVAVAIGLFTNEALTNCAKHAFPDGDDGNVTVRFECDEDSSWLLEVRDDGRQLAQGERGDHTQGLGTMLMNAFAQQAQATHRIDDTAAGRALFLESVAA